MFEADLPQLCILPQSTQPILATELLQHTESGGPAHELMKLSSIVDRVAIFPHPQGFGEDLAEGTRLFTDIMGMTWPTQMTVKQLLSLVHALCYWRAEYAIGALQEFTANVQTKVSAHVAAIFVDNDHHTLAEDYIMRTICRARVWVRPMFDRNCPVPLQACSA